jgi:hypothetical protein
MAVNGKDVDIDTAFTEDAVVAVVFVEHRPPVT